MNATSTRLPVHPVVPPHPQSPDGRWMGDMPLCRFAEFTADRAAPGQARRHLDQTLADWGLSLLRETARLVLSELITNAATATGAISWTCGIPPVRLWLRGDATRVRLLVGDAVPHAPVPRIAGRDEENGRGLMLVTALSAEWGHYRPVIPFGGKVTWSLICGP